MRVQLVLAACAAAVPQPLLSSAPAQPACAPVPSLILGRAFRDTRRSFAPDAPAFLATQSNFALAYRRACEGGLLAGDGIFRGVELRDHVVLHNAPDANIASLYRPRSVPASGRALRLEYYFVGHDGRANVPSADDLHEAIYCHVQGATEREQEEEGRCLPD